MAASETNGLRFAVIQLGARLHYALPAVLERAGLLHCLYTDAHAGSALFRALNWLPSQLKPSSVRRLLSRRIPSTIPRSKVRSWAWPAFQIQLTDRRERQRTRHAVYLHRNGIGGHWLARRALAENFAGANALYVHPCVSTDAVREAKRRGMFVVLETISHPFLKRIEFSEYRRFEACPPADNKSTINDSNLAFFKEEAVLADLVLAASDYVKEGLIELGLDPKRIAVVPYGLDIDSYRASSSPEAGRVLFVGHVGYLKGIPYLAEAARLLQTEGFKGELRAVGLYADELIRRPEFEGLRYVGQVPRADIKHEYLTADIFVFPTLSDGFGIVLLEAMAAGLPVICTPNCAKVVRNGENGFVVPIRDAAALAASIRRIVNNRPLRQALSERARRVAADFTLERYRDRLLNAFNGARLRCTTFTQFGTA